MPYNPGNQNISGQLMGQGILGAAQSLSSAFVDRSRQQEQDKLFTAQSKATENLLKSYLPKDQAAEVLKLDPNETPAARHARLSGTIENFVVENKLKEFQKQRAQQEKDIQALNQALGQFLPKNGAAPQFNGQQFMQSYFQQGGSPDSLDKVDQIFKAFATPQKALDLVPVRETGPNGEPIEVTYDKMTGRKFAQGPVGQNKYVLTPDEQIKVEGGKTEAQENAKRASEFVTSIVDAAETAQAILPQMEQIRTLYEAGAKSGFGQDFINTAGSFAARLGIGSPEQQANQEELQKLLANTALQTARELMKGTGQVSNYERELVNKASAELGKTPTANLRIIQLSEAISKRSVAAELERQKLVDEGKSTGAVAETLRRWRTKNPLDNFINKTETVPETAPSGVDPKLWSVMTPEEKKLWQN